MVPSIALRKLKSSVINFAENTTFHGVRYIYKSDSLFRRLMWVLFVLGCTCAVVYQIIDRVDYYYTLPINVNVKINYNQSLKFPAITICNQNAFRASAAADHGYYQLLEHMFSKTRNVTQADLQIYNVTDLTLDTLYRTLAHQKEDFIVSCTWNKRPCSVDDFEMVYTDHGVCFLFSQRNGEMRVAASGVEAGLQLTLNVEQYEYVAGPHNAAGVKMLVHDPLVSPSVHALGQAIPTGSHAFVGIKFMVIENLPTPHGDCAYKQLGHTEYYTTEECYRDCLLKLSALKCGCRNFYMPQKNGLPPVCTLSQYYNCLSPLEEEFTLQLRDHCGCPIPCDYSVFDPALSYSTISNHLVDKLLTQSETIALKDKLLKASEATARADNAQFDKFKFKVIELEETFVDFHKMVETLLNSVKVQRNMTLDFFDDVKAAYLLKGNLYSFQIHAVENNFIRAREAMEERTLRNIVFGYAEFVMLIRRRIDRLYNTTGTGSEFYHGREVLFYLITDALKTRIELIALAKENVTALLNAFYNGTPIFNYKFDAISRTHNKYIVPKPLMNYSLDHNSYVRNYSPKLIQDLNRMDDVLQDFLDITLEVYENNTLNVTLLDYVFERYQLSCRMFMHSKSIVYKQGLDYTLKVLTARVDVFEKHWHALERKINDIFLYLDAVINSTQSIVSNTIPKLVSIITHAKQYIKTNSHKLMDLADIFVSHITREIEGKITDTFVEVWTRSQAVNDALDMIRKPTQAIWTAIIDDVDMIDYYMFTNNTDFLRDLDKVITEWNDRLVFLKDHDVRHLIHNKDTKFETVLGDIIQHMKVFRNSINVEDRFVRENFLQLDVFFRQLSYEQVTQQRAYDIFALICDIGGSMGLFIGASMLTIVEIVDLFLTQTPLFRERKTSERKKRESNKKGNKEQQNSAL